MTQSRDLVLVPGLMCDEAVWEPLYPHLPAGVACQVVVHGDADHLTVMAQRLLEAAPARFALAGHSMGARVALEVMRLAPQRVERLALLDTGYAPLAAGAAGEAEKAKRQALLEKARAQGMRAMAAEWAQGMVHPDRLQDEALMEAILGMCERKTADQFAAQIRALLARPDGSEVLQSLQALGVPTLIACGRQDAWAPVAQHEAMHRLAPGAVLAFVEDAGHMAPMERPAETAAVINRWLAQPA